MTLADTLVLIAAYEEEGMIAQVVQGCLEAGVGAVVVIDDGSTDDTSARARDAGAHVYTHPVNCGKGSAMMTGIEAIKCDHSAYQCIVFMDADGQHDPSELGRLVEGLATSTISLGRRPLDTSTPLINKLGRYMGDVASYLHTGHWFYDSQCGYRAMTAAVLGEFDMSGARFDFEVNFLRHIHTHQLSYTYVPVSNIYTSYSLSKKNKQGILNGLQTLLSMINL